MRRSPWLAALCLLALALSWAYLQHYLRGGPRIIDATSYFLEARSLAQGSFTFQVPAPSAAFRGRFLLASADGHALGVIFPPGYPLVLALGVLLGKPLWVGPVLGALLVLATHRLARALGQSDDVALGAAALSALCGALRYHTADTMSHGLAALLTTTALAFSAHGSSLARTPLARWAPLLAGACLGLLAATRPVSAGVALCLCLVAQGRPSRRWLELALGTLPGVVLLLAQQRALTGSWLGSTQLAYYAAADAPAGCFRYGFGSGIGCRFEHGDYVERYLPHGYGFAAALRNLAVHLRLFASDATNFAPLTLLGAYPLVKVRSSALRLAGLGILLQALAYVPFYFDGNYPGGGARFLAEVIPLAQILVARGAAELFARAASRGLGAATSRWFIPAASAVAFVASARQGHAELAAREGGRPMFEPALLEDAGVHRGLVLVGTDHGFNLGHAPGVLDPHHGVVVARMRGDAHDRELYERLGRPPTYRYELDLGGRTPPRVVPFTPPPSARYEAEAEWPALLGRGNAYPTYYPCASGGRGLRLLPGSIAKLPLREPGPVALGWLAKTGSGAQLRVGWQGEEATEYSLTGPGCSVFSVPRPAGSSSLLIVELQTGEGALDFAEVRPSAP